MGCPCVLDPGSEHRIERDKEGGYSLRIWEPRQTQTWRKTHPLHGAINQYPAVHHCNCGGQSKLLCLFASAPSSALRSRSLSEINGSAAFEAAHSHPCQHICLFILAKSMDGVLNQT